MSDDINHPSHYVEGREIEPLTVIADWNLNFNQGQILKYLSRLGRKDDTAKDLGKLIFYASHELGMVEREANRGVRVGDTVEAVDAEDTPMLAAGRRYVVAGVNTGPVKTFVCFSDMPARYWEVTRFKVVES